MLAIAFEYFRKSGVENIHSPSLDREPEFGLESVREGGGER